MRGGGEGWVVVEGNWVDDFGLVRVMLVVDLFGTKGVVVVGCKDLRSETLWRYLLNWNCGVVRVIVE